MKRSLNLDRMFTPVQLPEIEFEMLKFNGGEQHIKLNNLIDYSEVSCVVISHRIKSGDDFIQIAIAKDALERKGVKDFDLIIPYVPYARQDRQCADGESFTLQVFADMLNNLKFNKIYMLDAHSRITHVLIKNSHNLTNCGYVREAVKRIGKQFILISPDSGANTKSNQLFDTLGIFTDLVKCDKRRDVVNGGLRGFEVFRDDLGGADCLIVDDICSRGGTFIGLAKELKKKNAGEIYLFVTHYEGCADEAKLKEAGIKMVYCTNSFSDYESDFVKQIKMFL